MSRTFIVSDAKCAPPLILPSALVYTSGPLPGVRYRPRRNRSGPQDYEPGNGRRQRAGAGWTNCFGEETSAVRDQVKTLLAAGKKKLSLNMEKVTFVDSTGLGMLVGVRESAKTTGAQLRLSNVEARYSKLLKVTQLWPLFDVSATESEAVRALAK
jgi:anti-sigma B factor antagonist